MADFDHTLEDIIQRIEALAIRERYERDKDLIEGTIRAFRGENYNSQPLIVKYNLLEQSCAMLYMGALCCNCGKAARHELMADVADIIHDGTTKFKLQVYADAHPN